MENKDIYFVAVKIFLIKDDDKLFIAKDCFGDWDIPGGRLKQNDFEVPLEVVAERKIKEELGDNIRYELGDPAVFMRHERDEILASGERERKGFLLLVIQQDIWEAK